MFLTAHQLNEALDKGGADWRVKRSDIEKRVVACSTNVLNDTAPENGCTVTCTLHLDNGYSVTGSAYCPDTKQFNADVMGTIARDNAYFQLQPLFDFLAAEKKHWFNLQVRQLAQLGENDDGL